MTQKEAVAVAMLVGVLAASVLAGKPPMLTGLRSKSILANEGKRSGNSTGQQAEAAAAPESQKEGGQILLAAAKAAGGRALLGVKSLGMDEKGEQFGAKGNVTLTVKWTVAYPDRSHGDVMFGTQPVIQTCDGKTAWVVIGDQERDATPTVGEFKRGIALFGGGWGLYREVLAGHVSGRAIGETEIDGRKANGVAVRAPFGDVALFFDPETHLLAAARFQTSTPRGMMDAEQRWSNYRSVGGRQFAFSTATYRGGAKLFESTVSTVKINPPVQESLFLKPVSTSAK